MDAHFNEYLAAVAGMAEIYGAAHDEAACDQACMAEEQAVVVAA